MGVQDLYPLLKRRCPSELHIVNVIELEGNKIAVDISIYMYRCVRSCGVAGWLDQFITFVCNLKRFRLHAVYVFDGPCPPPEKKKEQERRRHQLKRQVQRLKFAEELYVKLTNLSSSSGLRVEAQLQKDAHVALGKSVFSSPVEFSDPASLSNALGLKIKMWRNQTVPLTPDFAEKAKDVLTLLGLPFIQAEGEAETLCAFLAVNGIVDAVLSEDSDVLAYGTPLVFSQMTRRHGVATTFRVVSHPDVCTALKLSSSEFRDLCILLGCDYNSRVRMHGNNKSLPVGAVRAFELISKFRSLENMEKVLVDSTPLLYERCRDLFSVQCLAPMPAFKFTYPLPWASEEWKRFIEKNNSCISMEWIKHLWARPIFPFLNQ